MALDERIRILIDVVTDKATTSIKGFRQSVADADGVTGKFKASAGAAFGAVKANAAEFAMAAGSALVAFGVKSVQAFQDTALQAGKLSEALGISVEDASRLMEVSGDLGIEVGTVQGAIQRMNKAIGDGKVDRLGLSEDLVRTKDGAVDSYESFINLATSIGKLKDPTEKAQKAQQLFGRSYGEMAELMTMDAAELRAALDGVSEAKVIDQDELDKARRFRDSVDELRGKLEDLSLSVGEALVPALSDMADSIVAIDDAIAALPLLDGAGDVAKYGQSFMETALGIDAAKKVLGLFRDEAKLTEEEAEIVGTKLWNDTKGAIDNVAGAMKGTLVGALGEVESASSDAAFEVRTLEQAWADLKGQIDDRQAFMNVEDSFDSMREKGMLAYGAAMDGAADATEKTREYERAQLAAKDQLIDYLAEVLKLPPERSTKILAAFDEGNLDFVEAQLAILSRNRTMNLSIVAKGGVGFGDTRFGPRAKGGKVRAGDGYLVGENFDGTPNATSELVMPGEDGTVVSAPDVQSALRNMGYGPQSAAMVVDRSTTNIYLPAAATPTEVDRAQRDRRRLQGPL